MRPLETLSQGRRQLTANVGNPGPLIEAEKAALRRQLRETRRRIPPLARRRAAARVARRIAALARQRAPAHIAAYHAAGAELDLSAAVQRLRRGGFALLVPRLGADGMAFVRWPNPSGWMRGAHGIQIPRRQHPVRLGRRDLVLVPLLGVDEAGYRLGQGGGCYDRYFGGTRRRPFLVGIAYDQQCLASVPRADWDLRLDALITPSAYRRFR